LAGSERAGSFLPDSYLSIDLIKQMLYNAGMDKFDALADPTRRKIIEILARKGQLPAGDIYEHFDVSPQAVSQHLKVLREAKLVLVEKQAQQRIYRVNPAAVHEVEDWARELRQLWDQRFDAIERILQQQKDKENDNE
jgi:DNA-binding transcriptional ArsR family regulator